MTAVSDQGALSRCHVCVWFNSDLGGLGSMGWVGCAVGYIPAVLWMVAWSNVLPS